MSRVANSVGAYTLIRVTLAWLNHSQQAVPHCKSYSMLSGLVRVLALPEDCVSFSFRVPESVSRVSWRVAMSTFSLFSSSFMTAVFLESLVSCRLAERPVIIVRTFQTPVLKLVFFDNFVCGCLVSWFQSAFRVVPFPHAPNEDGRPWRDSTLLAAWGLLSLRRAIAVLWDLRISPTIGSNPWRRALHQSSDGL